MLFNKRYGKEYTNTDILHFNNRVDYLRLILKLYNLKMISNLQHKKLLSIFVQDSKNGGNELNKELCRIMNKKAPEGTEFKCVIKKNGDELGISFIYGFYTKK